MIAASLERITLHASHPSVSPSVRITVTPMVDWLSVVVGLLTAIGTLALAAAAFWSVKANSEMARATRDAATAARNEAEVSTIT